MKKQQLLEKINRLQDELIKEKEWNKVCIENIQHLQALSQETKDLKLKLSQINNISGFVENVVLKEEHSLKGGVPAEGTFRGEMFDTILTLATKDPKLQFTAKSLLGAMRVDKSKMRKGSNSFYTMMKNYPEIFKRVTVTAREARYTLTDQAVKSLLS